MIELSLEQEKAIDKEGRVLVKAPPGSGKTTLLCEKANRFLAKQNKRIITLTFSNKASVEIKDKVIKDERLFVGTIHAYAQHMVISRGHLIGLPKNLTIVNKKEEKEIILKEIIRDSEYLSKHLNDYVTGKKSIEKPLNYIKKQQLRFISPDDVLNEEKTNSELLFELYNAYMQKMKDSRLIDFDDLLFYAYQILQMPSTQKMLSSVYSSLFIDEAQDLNSTQYEIIKLIGQDIPNIMMVGDSRQSLYGFMDSSPRYMEENFVNDFSACVLELTNNYRSSKAIVNLINHFKDDKKSVNNYPIDGHVEYNRFKNEKEEATYIYKMIKKFLDEDTYKENEIAIIARNNYIFREIILEFERNDLSFNTGHNLFTDFETKYIQILLLLIRYNCNPKNIYIEEKLCNLLDLHNFDIQYVKDNYEELYNISHNEDFMSFSNSLLELKDHVKVSPKSEDNDKYYILNDILLLEDNLNNYRKSKLQDQKSVLDFINDFLMGKTSNFYNEGITIQTVHKSKGVEFEVVFFIGLNEGVLPDYRAKTEEALDDEFNNVFVGLSRPRKELYISSVKYRLMPWGKEKYQEESRYVKKIKQALANRHIE